MTVEATSLCISVVILTKNESLTIKQCIKSISWCDDIHILDSCSDDETVSIAQTLGATIHVKPFSNYADQRNAALRKIAFKHPWVLMLDADEQVSPDFVKFMNTYTYLCDPEISAVRMPRKDHLWGRWLKNAQLSPLFIRLVRPSAVHFERSINEILIVDSGAVVDIALPILHYPFSKGISAWVEKHNIYSTMEAFEISHAKTPPWTLAGLRSKDFTIRRMHQKRLFYTLPCRPIIRFLLIYFLRGGFLDGRAGFDYAVLQACYEFLIVIKTRERNTSA